MHQPAMQFVRQRLVCSDRTGMIHWNEFATFMTQLAYDDMAAFDDVCVALENRRRFIDIEVHYDTLRAQPACHRCFCSAATTAGEQADARCAGSSRLA